MAQNGEPHGYAGDLLSGVSRFIPEVRGHIPISRLWFRNWSRELRRERALPMPVHVMTGLAGLALAFRRWDLAGLISFAFLYICCGPTKFIHWSVTKSFSTISVREQSLLCHIQKRQVQIRRRLYCMTKWWYVHCGNHARDCLPPHACTQNRLLAWVRSCGGWHPW